MKLQIYDLNGLLEKSVVRVFYWIGKQVNQFSPSDNSQMLFGAQYFPRMQQHKVWTWLDKTYLQKLT